MSPIRDLAQHPKVQEILRRATSLRSDLMDQLDERLGGVAKKLNLVTRKEMKGVKRQVRELAREYGIADRRPRRTLVPPGAEQLSLATAIR